MPGRRGINYIPIGKQKIIEIGPGLSLSSTYGGGYRGNKTETFLLEATPGITPWSINGNSGTNPLSNFLGTVDNQALAIRTNNLEVGRFLTNGNFGLGTSTPTQKLSMVGSAAGNFGSIINNTSSAVNARSTQLFQNNVASVGFIALNSSTSPDYAGVGSMNMGTVSASPTSIVTNNISRLTVTGTGSVGIGTITPTSTFEVVGSQAGSVTVITATTVLNQTHRKIVANNGATNITITLPDALTCIGREYIISRYAGSTGTITVVGSGGNKIQALAGTVGATTTLGAHGAAGQGLKHSFTAVNVGGVGVWMRL